MIENIISELKDFRNNVDIKFEHRLNFTVKLGEVNTVPLVPRLAKSCGWFQPNIENDGPLSYHKQSLAIPFLDDINSKLEYDLKVRNHLEFFAIYHL